MRPASVRLSSTTCRFCRHQNGRVLRRPGLIVSGSRLYHGPSHIINWVAQTTPSGITRYATARPVSTQQRLYSSKRELQRNVFVALGSNVGDSVRNIEQACRMIDLDDDMRIVDTSCLYRTKPMYIENQDDFINGACEIETCLEPEQLLGRLQVIEQSLGRVKLIDKGPRNIDLDIIGFRDQSVKTERLTVPHALLHERSFVLRPLCDLKNGREWTIPGLNKQAHQCLAEIGDNLQPFTGLDANASFVEPLRPARTTMVMSIFNATPDSFSDGGKHFQLTPHAIQATIRQHIAEGANIIDIGGQSSRPHAPDVTAAEELDRIMPTIQAIKRMPEAKNIVISVDTYRAAVAEAAVKAGAHIINDIAAGSLDPDMLPTVARLGCTYIAMHMRGTPATMSTRSNCAYPDGVVDTVVRELQARLQEALEAGVRRWRIILDPGLGFAKDLDGNLALLRGLGKLRDAPDFRGLPWLVGPSRKRFIGTITHAEDSSQRSWGTAAAVTAAIAGGADIVRVHDVAPMKMVVRMADAIYRRDTQ